MTESLRVTCPTLIDIPPAHQFRAWVTDDRYVVLRLPPATLTGPDARASVVAKLADALMDFRVFDSGWDRTHELVTLARPVAGAVALLPARL